MEERERPIWLPRDILATTAAVMKLGLQIKEYRKVSVTRPVSVLVLGNVFKWAILVFCCEASTRIMLTGSRQPRWDDFKIKTRGKSPHYLRLLGFYFGDSNQILKMTHQSYTTEIGKTVWLFAKLQPGRARKRINAT